MVRGYHLADFMVQFKFVPATYGLSQLFTPFFKETNVSLHHLHYWLPLTISLKVQSHFSCIFLFLSCQTFNGSFYPIVYICLLVYKTIFWNKRLFYRTRLLLFFDAFHNLFSENYPPYRYYQQNAASNW